MPSLLILLVAFAPAPTLADEPTPVAGGRMELATGSYVGDGSAGRAITGLGFRPDVVIIKNDDSNPAHIRTSTMSGTKNMVDDQFLLPGLIISLDADGFTIGAPDHVNKPGADFYWVAFRAAAGELALGSFLGDDTDNRNITGVGFRPDYVIVMTEDDGRPYQKSASMEGDASVAFDAHGLESNRIQLLLPDGFQVGSDRHVNENGYLSHYIAWKAIAKQANVGTYVGNGSDDRDITGVGFQPEYVLLQSDSGEPGAHRPASVSGDLTLEFENSQGYPDGIQQFLADGFQVGTAKPVNDDGKDIFWMAFRDPIVADLSVSKGVDDEWPDEGATITYTIALTNLGPRNATSVQLKDILPAGVTYVSDTPSQGSYDELSGLWDVGTIAAGSGAALMITATVNAGTAGSTITNTAAVRSLDQIDPNPGNNTGSVDIHPQAADLALAMGVDDPFPYEGETVSITITLANAGPSDATGILVRDLLPAGLTYFSDIPTQGVYDSGSGIWLVGDVPASGVAALKIIATVDSGTGGSTLENTAAITASAPVDPMSGNNAAKAAVSVRSPGPVQLATGSYVGNNADNRAITGLKFRPDLVIVKASTAEGAVCRTSTMSGDVSKHLGGQWTLYSNRIQSLEADGFTVGNDADVNQFGVTYYWTAFKAGPGQMDLGTYTGNGMDNREISGLGFTPVLAIVLSEGAHYPWHRSSTMSSGHSLPFAGMGSTTNRIQALTADGFQIGSSEQVNFPGIRYHYIAWTEIPGRVGNGTYVGNDTDNRDIKGLGFQPDFVFIKEVGPSPSLHRPASLAGDAAQFFAANANAPNNIQALQADGFQIGSSWFVNDNLYTYHWCAFSASPVTDIAIAKTASDSLVNEGDPVVFTLDVRNEGPDDATGVRVVDLLPAGVTYVSDTPSQGSYDYATGRWTVGALSAGGGATLDLRVTVDPGTAGSRIRNIAAVTVVDQTDPSRANDVDSVSVQVEAVDLEVEKTVDNATPDEGDTIQYTVTLTNLGPNDATGVELTDALPAGVTYVSDTPSQGSYDDIAGLWTVGALAAADSATLAIVASVNPGTAGSTITNTAAVSETDQTDTNAANDADSVAITVKAADLAVTKTVDVPNPNEGDTIQYTVTVQNLGPANASGIALTDSLPAGVTYVSDTPSQGGYDDASGIWDVGAITAGGSATLALFATIDAGTGGSTITNIASVTASDQGDPVAANDADSASVTVRSADLAVTKSVDNPTPNESDPITYTVTVTNAGPSDATDVEITDLLPAGVTYVSDTPSQGAYASGTGLWSVGAIALGDSATLDIAATVDVGTLGLVITNTAALTAVTPADPNSSNDSDSTDIAVQGTDLEIVKEVDDPVPAEGGTVQYTLTVRNLGPGAATGVEVTDLLPAGVTYVSDVPSQGAYASGTGLWSVGAVANADSAMLTITATVAVGTAGSTIVNVAEVTAADQPDPESSNNSDDASIRVEAVDLQIVKTVDDPTPNEGDSLTYTVTVTNLGPDDASGIEVTDLLPVGVTFVSKTMSQGSYGIATGLWTVGAIAATDSATLALVASVDAGTAGSTITNAASVTALDQVDPVAANNTDSVAVTVQSVDLEVEKDVDNATPNEGDSVTYHVTVRNLGPHDATGVEVTDLLPAGVNYASDTPSQGGYASATGLWTVGAIAAADSATLSIGATVALGTAGLTITNVAAATALDQTDTNGANDADSVAITIQSADLALEKSTDNPAPHVGESFTYTLLITNLGPDGASGVEVTDLLPAGVTYVSDTPSQGSYASDTGLWSAGSIAAGDSATLAIATTVDFGAGGSTVVNVAAITGADQADTNAGNNADSVAIDVPEPAGQVEVIAYAQSGATLRPGATAVEVLRFSLSNRGSHADTLVSLTLTNTTTGPGTQEELDAEWRSLELSFQMPGSPGVGGPGLVTVPLKKSFTGGVATFPNLNAGIDPGDTLVVFVKSGASIAARDGDTLDLTVADAGDLVFADTVILSGDLPVDPPGGFPVDGMTAVQILLEETASSNLLTGSTRNVVLRAVVPANGYSADVLQRVDITNRGTALAGTDIERLELWADADRDSAFAAGSDLRLGALTYTGSRWEITGLSQQVPTTGVRLFVTCDVAELATAGRTLMLALPTAPDVAIGMASNNDGPVDREVENVSHQTISTVNRVILAASPISSGVAAPGEDARALLHLVATNTYSVPRTLTFLTVTNTTSGSGSGAQLDAECEFVHLHEDGDDNGIFNASNDPDLATAFFSSGEASLSGFSWTLAAGETRHLFVSVDVSLLGATDGDVIRANVDDPSALGFASGDVSTAASWPLDSGAGWTVDGMIAAQITNFGAPVATLGPNEGPALALDIRIPRNGYADDVLRGVTLTNHGTATSTDIAKIRLWRDGGDGIFDAGFGDDTDLGPTTYLGGNWTSSLLSVPVSAGGVRLFGSVTSSLAPADSATVQLAVVTDGITMDSNNDGPRDVEIENPNALLLSTAALLATFELDPAASTVGQGVVALLHVRNVGPELISGIAPSALDAMGDGTLSLLGGPTPPAFDLAPGAESTFVWTCQADSAGTVRFAASAAGIEEPSGLTRQSLTAISNPHSIFLQAQDLKLFPVESMPFSITRGQTEVVPLSLTFANSGDSTASAVRLVGLKIRLADESGAGIVPADLVSRVVVNEGANIYLEKTSLETSGAEIDLTLAQPVVIESQGLSGGQVTLSLSFDISDTTAVPNFRIAIDDSTWFVAEDATNGAPVNVSLQQGGYPIQSGLARVVAEATELRVSCPAPTPRRAGQGQPNVPLLDLELLNYDEHSLAADVRLSAFSVTLTDSSGQPLSEPAAYLERIRVRTAVQELLERPVTVADDSTLALLLSPLLSLPVNAPVGVSITADLADAAPLGAIRLRLSDSTSFDARDANTGKPVAVIYASDPIAGGLVTIEAPADTVLARAVSGIEPQLMVGESDVTALVIEVVHPGGAGAARARCDSLTIQLRDSQHDPLVPAEYLSRLAVLRNSAEIGVLSDLPTKDDGTATIALSDTYFEPADTTILTIRFDLRATSPASFLELMVPGTGFHVFDDNLGLPVAVQPAAGAEFPLGSGLTQLMAPARELAAGFESLLPKVLASNGPTAAAARLRLENVATATASDIRVERIELRAGDRDYNELGAGEVFAQVRAFIGEELWAESGALTETQPTAVVTAATPLVLSPGQPVEVEIVTILRPSPKTGSLRIGCRASGIGVIQPENPLLAVTVQPEEGQSFPFWSNAAGFTPCSLAESYSNFPNPFAAGRSETRFVFNLPAPARVTLRVWSARGERVKTLLDSVSLAAGLYQEHSWDGRNGRGETVVNGVYVAELTVDFADGSHERLLRKVAVVR